MDVEVYSGTEKVQLFLNGKLIGGPPASIRSSKQRSLSPYTPGTLKVVGLRGNRPVAESVLVTAGNATSLRLTPDRQTIHAGGQDLSFISVEAVDAQGKLQPNADQEGRFSITGPGTIAAVGNGDGQDTASYQGNKRKLFQGLALVVVRTSSGPGSSTCPRRFLVSRMGLRLFARKQQSRFPS